MKEEVLEKFIINFVDRYKEKWLNTLNRVKRTLYIGTMPRS